MSNKNQREQLMYSAIGNIAMITCVLLCVWIYILPRYSVLSAMIDETNTTISRYIHTSTEGLSYAEVDTILRATKWREELLAIIQTAPTATKEAIKKSGNRPYLEWLKSASDDNQDDKGRLALKKARLNSILPTLNPESNNMMEDAVSMRRYVAFIEKNILRQFHIESTTTLGIQNIQYGKKGGDIPESVGSFDAEITFTANNSDIANMIDYINALGHPEILSDTGTTIPVNLPEIMSNPIVVIDALSLRAMLDPNKPNEDNGGRITLRFYVRGSSKTDIDYLAGTLASHIAKLKTRIDANLKDCSADLTCSKLKDIQKISYKYNEFIRGTQADDQSTGVEKMYRLSAKLNSINAIEKELTSLTGK